LSNILSDKGSKMVIEGGKPLVGDVKISGSKNAALPIMAAALLSSNGTTKLENLPIVSDILTLADILRQLGASVNISGNSALISASEIGTHKVSLDNSKRMRASYLVAGPLLARTGEAIIAQPGGCVIGDRPIDLHLSGFQKLGAKIEHLNKDYVKLTADRLKGCQIDLPFPSVGATENLMLAASFAEGRTIITNAAREPEIIDTADFLTRVNARITGAGTSVVKIDGVKRIIAGKHKIIPDRIEAGSFMIASAITGGEIQIKNIEPEHLIAVQNLLEKIGVRVTLEPDSNTMVVISPNKLSNAHVTAIGYPGFPTDLQPLMTALLSLSNGESTVTDAVFPHRFCYVSELNRMGASIKVKGNTATIQGVTRFFGDTVCATDLRAGFALIMAGLAAQGKTIIDNMHYVDRGYENVAEKLKKLGASITRITS